VELGSALTKNEIDVSLEDQDHYSPYYRDNIAPTGKSLTMTNELIQYGRTPEFHLYKLKRACNYFGTIFI
jgi:hypothetical protein